MAVDATVLERVVEVLERSPHVRLAYVFGSVARGQSRAESDVDIAVLLDAPSSRAADVLREQLEEAARREVDLVLLDRAPPLLLSEVLREGRVIVSRSDDERAELELRAQSVILDTEHLRAVQRSYLRERAESRRGAQT